MIAYREIPQTERTRMFIQARLMLLWIPEDGSQPPNLLLESSVQINRFPCYSRN
jgi:hypothetical protein